MKRLITAVLVALSVNLAFAVEVEGVNFEDRIKLGSSDLVLNGTGVRSKFGKRYVAALYVPTKSSDANTVLSAKGAKRMALHLLKDGDGKTFAKAFAGGIEDNTSGADLTAIQDRVKTFSETILSLGDVKEGSKIMIDFTPEKGTQVSINGKTQGKEIAGEDFYKALLKVWLGEDPAQKDLKAGLLGKP